MGHRKSWLASCTALMGLATTACQQPHPAPTIPVAALPAQTAAQPAALTPDIAAPGSPASSPPTAQTAPAVTAPTPAAEEKTAIVSKTSPKTKGSKPATAAAAPSSSTAAAAQPSAAPPTLDLAALKQRLRDTHAIGIMTKLSLKNQVDDLLDQIKKFHQGNSSTTLAQLRQSYESLLLQVVSLLQKDDPQLASAVSGSRESLWSLLSDPVKFSQLS